MSIAPPLSKSSSVKCVQKLSKPRPLKLGSSGESENVPPLVSPVALTYANVDNINEDDVLCELESLHVSISNGNFEPATSAQVARVCHLLKLQGAHMDAGGHRDQLDVYMVTLRSAARDDRLDVSARTRLLEVLELRSLKWRLTEDVAEFYKKLEPDSRTVTQVGGGGGACGGGQVVLSGAPMTLQQVQQQMQHQVQQQQQQQQVQANGHGHGHGHNPAMIIPQYIPFTQFPMSAGGHVQPNVLTNVNVNVPLGQVRQQVQAAAAVQAVQAAAAAQAVHAQAQAAQAAQQAQAAQAVQQAQAQAAAQQAAQAAAAAAAAAAVAAQPPFMPGEVLRSSGKFGKPAKVPGRNFLKDEVIIRNADSGKVMGIKGRRVHMIEELSDTVISFQRVSPGARDRLVQITGPTEDSILQAKQLIEETIRRNASPVREPSSQEEEEESSGGSSYGGGPHSPSAGASSPSAGALSPHEGPHSLGSASPSSGLVGSGGGSGGAGSCSSNSNGNGTTGSGRIPPPLQHSLSTGDATTERDYTYMVQGIKISAPKQQLALAAKAVLEQHFSAVALILTEPNFIRVSEQASGNESPPIVGVVGGGGLAAAATTGGGGGSSRGVSGYFHGSGKAQAGDGGGGGWSSSSSSDEDTYRRDSVQPPVVVEPAAPPQRPAAATLGPAASDDASVSSDTGGAGHTRSTAHHQNTNSHHSTYSATTNNNNNNSSGGGGNSRTAKARNRSSQSPVRVDTEPKRASGDEVRLADSLSGSANGYSNNNNNSSNSNTNSSNSNTNSSNNNNNNNNSNNSSNNNSTNSINHSSSNSCTASKAGLDKGLQKCAKAVLTRDQILDLATSELTKKAPEDLDNLDPDFAVVIMRQDLAKFDVEAFRKWSPSGSGPSSASSTSAGHGSHKQMRPSPHGRSPPSSNDSEENNTS